MINKYVTFRKIWALDNFRVSCVDKRFDRIRNLLNIKYGQMRIHQDKEHKPQLQCEHCEYQTYSAQDLRRQKVKHFDPTFKCSHCDKMLRLKRLWRLMKGSTQARDPLSAIRVAKGSRLMVLYQPITSMYTKS